MEEGDLSLEEREEKLQWEEVCEGRGPSPAQQGERAVHHGQNLLGWPASLPGDHLGSHLPRQDQNSMVCYRAKRALLHQLLHPYDGRSSSMA